MTHCLVPLRLARGVLAAGALVLASSCSSPNAPPPGERPQAPPVDNSTGVVLDEAEVAQRVALMKAQLEEEARKHPPLRIWNSLDEMPLVDTVEAAENETIDSWIRDLGKIRGDASRKARNHLIAQGTLVADRLRQVAGEPTLRGLLAAEILQILEPRFELDWTLDRTTPFLLTADGSYVLSWQGEDGPSLTMIDPKTGTTRWVRTQDEIEKAAPTKPRRFRLEWPERPQPEAFSDPALCVIRRVDDQVVLAAFSDGALSVVTDSLPPGRRLGRRSDWVEFHHEYPPDAARISWSKNQVGVLLQGGQTWIPLTMGTLNPRVKGIGFSRFHLHVLLEDRVNTYGRGSLKMESDTRVPGCPQWMHVSAASGEIVVGGPGWRTFAVLRGFPPVVEGRAPGEQGEMTAMASDAEGRWIATADRENFIRIFLAETLERVQTIAAGVAVDQLVFSGDGSTLVAVSTSDAGWRTVRTLHAYRLANPAK